MLYAGWHLLGTARMGNDPERSVVNGWGRSHDVKNLFIVDGSIFVTSGGVNPTSTIQALALYIADAHEAASGHLVRLRDTMHDDTLTEAEIADLRCLAGMIIPPSAKYGLPGADDDRIFADIVDEHWARPEQRARRAGHIAQAGRRSLRRVGCVAPRRGGGEAAC